MIDDEKLRRDLGLPDKKDVDTTKALMRDMMLILRALLSGEEVSMPFLWEDSEWGHRLHIGNKSSKSISKDYLVILWGALERLGLTAGFRTDITIPRPASIEYIENTLTRLYENSKSDMEHYKNILEEIRVVPKKG